MKLISGAFAARSENPGLGQARALQRAMVAMIDEGGPNAHPAVWAPFIVVGSDGQHQIAEENAPFIVPPFPEKAPAKPAVKEASRERGETATSSRRFRRRRRSRRRP